MSKRTNILKNSTTICSLPSYLGIAIAVSLLGTTTVDVHAQSILDEVVVTAQKREEGLQSVPLSVSALTGEMVDELGFQQSLDVLTQFPNADVQFTGVTPAVTIRGNSVIDFGDANEPPAGFYIDEVYRGTLAGQLNQVFDVERVELLRGPQGILYGRNTTAGLIHFVTRKPTDTFEARGSVQYGSFNQVVLDGAASGPITSRIRGRVAFKYNRNDAFQENIALPGEQEFGTQNVFAGRGQIEIDFSDNFTGLFSVSGSHEDSNNQGYAFFGAIDPMTGLQCTPQQLRASQCVNGSGFQDPNPDPRNIFSEANSLRREVDIIDAIARLSWQINDRLDLISVTGYQSVERTLEEDGDATATGAFGGAFGFGPINFLSVYGVDAEQISQEVRLQGQHDRLEWLAGLFYYNDDKNPVTTESAPGFIDTSARIETQSIALFGKVDVNVTEELTVSGGLRWTEEDRDVNIFTAPGFGGPGGTSIFNISTSKLTFRTSLDWAPTESVLAYGSVSTGFKSPESNALFLGGNVLASAPVGEEQVISYELGLKLTLWGGRARINTALFYDKIEDKQAVAEVPTGPGGGFASRLFNIGDVDVKGLESELSLNPAEGLNVSLAIGLLDTEVDAPPGLGVSSTLGTGLSTGFGDFFPFDGNELTSAPNVSINGIVRYELPFVPMETIGTVTLQTDFSWKDDVFFDISNNPFDVQESFGLVNLRMFWDSPNDRYHFQGFVENVANKEHFTGTFFPAGSDTQAGIWGHPRVFGIKFGVTL